jgi:hypothetical protein
MLACGGMRIGVECGFLDLGGGNEGMRKIPN